VDAKVTDGLVGEASLDLSIVGGGARVVFKVLVDRDHYFKLINPLCVQMARQELLLDGPFDLTPEIFHFNGAEELTMEACIAVEAVMGASGEI
jgi:hypothetical protein